MDISSLKKFLDLEVVDLSQVCPVFAQRPANAIVLDELTTEESFLFVTAYFCLNKAELYAQRMEEYLNSSQNKFADENDLVDEDDLEYDGYEEDEEDGNERDSQFEELNNQYFIWLEKNKICRMLLSYSVRSRLSISYFRSVFFLEGFLVSIDPDEDYNLIDADKSDDYNLFLN